MVAAPDCTVELVIVVEVAVVAQRMELLIETNAEPLAAAYSMV